MKMTFRWFGESQDPIPLRYIKQIPGVTGVVTSLLDIPAGEAWPESRIRHMTEQIAAAGLEVEVIESVNIHEDIKLGLAARDEKIESYILTMERLAKYGIKCICYNMMPVIDWARSDLYYDLPDGSNTMRYEAAFVDSITPEELAARYAKDSQTYEMPGWEPERMKKIREALAAYEGMSEAAFYANMKYFLDAIIPHAERLDIKMAVHPDDPPRPIFGLPKLIISRENIRKYLALHPSKHNGLTLCTGSLGAKKGADIPAIIREFGELIHFAHVRNLKFENDTDFYESAHLTSLGSLDMYEIMKALSDIGFSGWVRPDHGRMIWDEATRKGRPGYGLYDRALGAAYLLGLWEGLRPFSPNDFSGNIVPKP
ncbi:MAG: mannonate dehydratase [Defluviitaleaceae bacterium]|nr:mannonate dehydratase [Defluviitaleaceae bacterium]